MKIIKEKSFAIIIMILTLFIALVPIGHVSLWKALLIIFILLVVFSLIDISMTTLSKTKGKIMSTVIAAIAMVAVSLAGEPFHVTDNVEIREDPNIDSSVPAISVDIKKADDCYDLGIFYYEKGDYEQAILTLSEVNKNSDYYMEAKKVLSDAMDQYRIAIIATANTYVEKDDYKLAIDILNEGLLVIPQDTELTKSLAEYTSAHTTAIRTAAIDDAETMAANKDYANAILTIQNAINELDNDTELNALYSKYVDEYRNDILTQAATVLRDEGYKSAIQFVQDSLKILPGDAEFTSAITEFETYAPVYLIENIDYLQKTTFYYGGGLEINNDALTDSDGNNIFGHYHFHCDNTDLSASITFDLAEQYRSFCGTLVLPEKYKHTTSSIYVYLYGDDRLLYQSPNMTAGFHTEEFAVDVTGISTLEIKMENKKANANTDNWGIGYLTNAYLSKLAVNGSQE